MVKERMEGRYLTLHLAPNGENSHVAAAVGCERLGAELGERLHDRRGEGAEVVQLFGDDGMDHIQVQAGVFMHGHIAEANHPLHAGRQLGWQNPGSLQEGERITAVLRNTETPLADDVHGEVDRGFTGSLEIEDNRILFRLIRHEILLIPDILFENPLEASFDAGGFVEDDVVSHRPARAR